MHNPAADLRALFESWQTGPTPHHARSMDEGGIEKHLLAMRYVADCARILDLAEVQGSRVAVHQRALNLCVKAIINHPYNWFDKDADKPFTDHLLDAVEGLETFISMMNYAPIAATSQSIERMIAEIIPLLMEDDSLDPDIKGHVYRTIRTLQRFLEDEHFSPGGDFAEAVYDLWVATNAAAGSATDPESADRWRDKAKRLWEETRGSTIAAMPANAIALTQLVVAAQQLQIG
ncbi:hypothetical protein ACFY5D_03550 [Paeniglutamicibacter sp. NPDC012692]|uniref:hypothetical protein n=1 Tax=Paeniglutamicibacter sp. NPDC012692 TaxID=3364388 RepID=UPI0036C3AAA4